MDLIGIFNTLLVCEAHLWSHLFLQMRLPSDAKHRVYSQHICVSLWGIWGKITWKDVWVTFYPSIKSQKESINLIDYIRAVFFFFAWQLSAYSPNLALVMHQGFFLWFTLLKNVKSLNIGSSTNTLMFCEYLVILHNKKGFCCFTVYTWNGMCLFLSIKS